jgi:hypothetical protein
MNKQLTLCEYSFDDVTLDVIIPTPQNTFNRDTKQRI